jgi:hypothetical protein
MERNELKQQVAEINEVKEKLESKTKQEVKYLSIIIVFKVK